MGDAFDAYHLWLGIRPEEQPPNCYRLLGLPVFEDDTETIENAANQRMTFLKTFQSGPHGTEAHRLLNEVSAARLRLLNSAKKSAYDQQLRQQLEAQNVSFQPPIQTPGPSAIAPPATLPPASAGGMSFSLGARAEQPAATISSLGQIDEYRLLEKLGQGGMGTVYKALHVKLDRVVALKVLSQSSAWDDRAVARFYREMKAVGSLDHPNIVRAMDAREVQGVRLLVMEYVEGLDVNTLGRAFHPLPIADACEIVRQAALGLEEACRHGLVHRDVKPSNLMVTPQGVVKLLDLGLARFQIDQTAEDEVTGTGQAMGTIEYMAPEQVSDSRSVDIRADIYSLGCTLYKLLAGQTPFGGAEYKTPLEKLTAHARDPIPPIRRFRGDVPEELVRILGRMLAKDPTRRFATPAEVADAVGPLAMASNLAALLARAEGRPAPEPGSTQSLMPTQEISSSSGFTRFIQEIVEDAEASMPPPLPAKRRALQRLAIVFGSLVLGMTCLAAALFWVFALQPQGEIAQPETGRHAQAASTPESKTYLVLQWPAEERSGASMELDGQPQDMERLELLSVGGQISLPLEPGEHKVAMRRLGYEPFDQSFTVTAGKDVKMRPIWKELTALAKQDVPQPPTSPLSPAGRGAEGEGAKPSPGPSPQPSPKGGGSKPVAAPEPQESPDAIAARKRLEALDARYAEAMKPVDKLAAAWDFKGAAVALREVRFEEKELQDRLAQRRDELKRMDGLKQKIIAKINEARPPFKKASLGMRGMGGDVLKADEAGITAQLINGKSESLAWGEAGAKAASKLLHLAVDPSRADDWLAAALVALASDEVVLAEKCFEQARASGANIDPYLAPLAAAALVRVKDLLDKQQFAEADAALAGMEQKYGKIPWFASHKKSIDTARTAARAGIHETEAEKLYSEAGELFAQKEFFDLKPLVEKLKTDYATTRPVTDATRKPSFADLEKATANLGKRLIVRQDGKGNFTTIQAAIDAAPPNTTVEVEDNGVYAEQVTIAAEKHGLALRGKRGRWPIISSVGSNADGAPVVIVNAPRVSLERLLVVPSTFRGAAAASKTPPTGICVYARPFRVRWTLIGAVGARAFSTGGTAACEVEQCLIFGESRFSVECNIRNCVFAFSFVALDSQTAENQEVESCTMDARVTVQHTSRLVNSVVNTVSTMDLQPKRALVANCNVFGVEGFGVGVAPGKGCISADPMFRDPANLDYRLMPGSPCIGKASDGGDIGCRYTPEMIELCKQALELRRKGILKF